MKTIEGKLIAQGVKVGIVAARFNEFITSRLLSGAMDGLSRHGVKEDEVDLAWVPGAFEIPLAASKMAKSGKYDAVLCLGAVIRGSTGHYDYVCSEVSKGIASVSLQSGVPVMFGVLTTEWTDILWSTAPQCDITAHGPVLQMIKSYLDNTGNTAIICKMKISFKLGG